MSSYAANKEVTTIRQAVDSFLLSCKVEGKSLGTMDCCSDTLSSPLVKIISAKDLGRWESLEMVHRYTGAVTFEDGAHLFGDEAPPPQRFVHAALWYPDIQYDPRQIISELTIVFIYVIVSIHLTSEYRT